MDSPSNSPEPLSKPNGDWRDNNLFAKVYYHGIFLPMSRTGFFFFVESDTQKNQTLRNLTLEKHLLKLIDHKKDELYIKKI